MIFSSYFHFLCCLLKSVPIVIAGNKEDMAYSGQEVFLKEVAEWAAKICPNWRLGEKMDWIYTFSITILNLGNNFEQVRATIGAVPIHPSLRTTNIALHHLLS